MSYDQKPSQTRVLIILVIVYITILTCSYASLRTDWRATLQERNRDYRLCLRRGQHAGDDEDRYGRLGIHQEERGSVCQVPSLGGRPPGGGRDERALAVQPLRDHHRAQARHPRDRQLRLGLRRQLSPRQEVLLGLRQWPLFDPSVDLELSDRFLWPRREPCFTCWSLGSSSSGRVGQKRSRQKNGIFKLVPTYPTFVQGMWVGNIDFYIPNKT